MKRLRIGVIYGGRSGEHEVSMASAASVIANLDPHRYEIVPVRIEKTGRWTLPDRPPTDRSAAAVVRQSETRAASRGRPAVYPIAQPGDDHLLIVNRQSGGPDAEDDTWARVTTHGLDVVFPVLHGPYGEDGTIQGLLELAGLPYVGCGVLASAVGMDKAIMKVLFAAHALPIVAHRVVPAAEWLNGREATMTALAEDLGFPLFVKPANLGSSVGISRVDRPEALGAAIDLAVEFDRKAIVEAAVPGAREIECGVLGNDDPDVSLPGEIFSSREFYDYEAKYLDDTSRTVVPAELTDEQREEIQRSSRAAFRAIDGAGMARVDFLIDGSGKVFLNEINTVPGFTTISMYALMWEASGVSYPALLDRLIALAQARHAEKARLRTSV